MKKWWILLVFLCAGCSIRPVYDRMQGEGRAAYVNTISGRDGQILHSELTSLIKSRPNSLNGYTINVELDKKRRGFAYDGKGIANRLAVLYIANVSVTDKQKHKFIMQDTVSISQTHSISGAAGEIIFSLYPDHEKELLKKLADRIFDRLNVKCKAIKNENRT